MSTDQHFYFFNDLASQNTITRLVFTRAATLHEYIQTAVEWPLTGSELIWRQEILDAKVLLRAVSLLIHLYIQSVLFLKLLDLSFCLSWIPFLHLHVSRACLYFDCLLVCLSWSILLSVISPLVSLQLSCQAGLQQTGNHKPPIVELGKLVMPMVHTLYLLYLSQELQIDNIKHSQRLAQIQKSKHQ